MSDLKIGDRVTGIKGNTRVTGTVMNIKEGHVHIKAPVSGVYAPLVSIVPLHKVTKLGEGAMKRKAEDEDDAGMSDYMHHAQTSAPFDNAKPSKPHKDQFGNKIKIGNVAKNLAKQGMRGVKKEEVETIDEWRHSENERHSKRIAKGMSPEESHAKMKKTRDNEENARREKRAAAKLAKEEVEQIDEVGDTKKGREALAAYITKASGQSASLRGLGVGFDNDKNMYAKKALRARTPETKEKARADMETSGRLSSRFNRKSYNRTTGISRAAVRLAKEEVEQIEESKKTTHTVRLEYGPLAHQSNYYDVNAKDDSSAKKKAIKQHRMHYPYDSEFMLKKNAYIDKRHQKEEVELDEVGPQKRLKRVFNKLRDARAGAAYKQSGMPVPEREPGHKNTVDHNKALGRALRKMSEDLHSRKVYEPTSAQELNPGLRAKIDAASNAQKPAPAGRRPIGKIKLMTREEAEQVEEGYKARRAFGSAYDKTHDPFQDSKRRFKSRELEHELAHEAPSGPAHHDQTPHDVHIDGKKWKTFGSAGHAHNVANKLSISGKKASVHKTPIAEAAPKDFDEYSKQEKEKDTARKVLRYGGTGIGRALLHGAASAFVGKKNATKIANKFGNRAQQDAAVKTVNKYNMKIKESDMSVDEKAPPGWEGTVKAMKKHPEIDNPYALAWWMKRKGAKSHKGEK